MHSMRIFLDEKQVEYGIRISMENYSTYDNIRVIPLYSIADFLSE